jgi:hypothetical protein
VSDYLRKREPMNSGRISFSVALLALSFPAFPQWTYRRPKSTLQVS